MSCCCPDPLSGGRPAGSAASSELAGAPGWELAATVDFANDPTQNLADGVITIDGVDFTVANSVNAATWRVLNGSGLQMAAAAVSTSFTTAGQSAPWLRASWASIVPNYDPTRRYQLQARTSVNNSNAASERFIFGVFQDLLTPTGSAVSACGTFVGHNGVAQMAGFYAANSAGTGSVDYAATDVLVWVSSPGSPSGAAGLVGNTVAGAYPPQSALRNVPWNQETGTPAAITGDIFTDPECEVFLAFPSGNATGTFAVTVTDFRVLVAA